jgi:hypothetical protein
MRWSTALAIDMRTRESYSMFSSCVMKRSPPSAVGYHCAA